MSKDNDVAKAELVPVGTDRPRAASPSGDPPVTLDSEIFNDVSILLSAHLGQGTMTVGDLLALKAGSLVKLDTALDGQVTLTLNERLVAKGEIVAVGDHFGVRVTEMVAVRR